jgi:RNase adaptor protein for sRNA GlmZ degradation
MGKIKELFMRIHYPEGNWDLEREWRINDSLKEEQEYLEYLALKQDPDVNIDYTKIEVKDGSEARIEVYQEKQGGSTEIEVSGDRSEWSIPT